jgi:superkiller protein 3
MPIGRQTTLRPGGARTVHALLGALAVIAAVVTTGCGGSESGGDAAAPAAPAPDVSGIPAVDLDALEPSLANRLRDRLDAVAAAPDSGEAWGMLGVAFDVHELFAEAVTCYEQAIEREPDEFRWRYLLGTCVRLGNREEALAQLLRAAELRPDYAPTYCRIGQIQLLDNDLDGAEASFIQALERNPKLLFAQVGLGKVALARDDAEAAVLDLNKGLALAPQSGETHWLLAEAHRRLGAAADAAEHDRIAGAGWGPEPVIDPFYDGLRWNEGVTMDWRRRRSAAYAARGELSLFIAEWEAAMQDAPDAAEPYLELGQAYMRARKFGEAVKSFEEATRLEPENAIAFLGLGAALSSNRAMEAAVVAYEKALELDPDLHEARGNLGAALIRTGRREEGIEQLRQTAEALPNEANAQYNYARGLASGARHQEALAACNAALAIDPDHLQARFERGRMLALLGQTEFAIPDFEFVRERRPEMSAAHGNLAQAYFSTGRVDDAIRVCEEGLDRFPEDPGLLGSLAWIRATSPDESLRDGAEAVELATRLNKIHNFRHPGHLDILAAAAAEAGEWEVAIRYANSALDILLHPSGPGAIGPVKTQIDAIEARIALYEQQQPYRFERPGS